MSILDILTSEGYTIHNKGRSRMVDPCPFCSKFGHFHVYIDSGRYFSFSGCVESGDYADFLVKYKGLTLCEALNITNEKNTKVQKYTKREIDDYKEKINDMFLKILKLQEFFRESAKKEKPGEFKRLFLFLSHCYHNYFMQMHEIDDRKKSAEYYKQIKNIFDSIDEDIMFSINEYAKFEVNIPLIEKEDALWVPEQLT